MPPLFEIYFALCFGKQSKNSKVQQQLTPKTQRNRKTEMSWGVEKISSSGISYLLFMYILS